MPSSLNKQRASTFNVIKINFIKQKGTVVASLT